MPRLNKETLSKSIFIKQWKEEMIVNMKRLNPNWKKSDIDEVLDKMLLEQMYNPDVELDNNYTHEHKQASAISVLDWVLKRNPIVAGNATFYKNQLEAINPIADMVNSFLVERKAVKKKMFQIEDDQSDEYKDLDRLQGNVKRLANSYYGGSGMPQSAFYSKWSGPATTGTAQSVISTTETLFEGYLVNNYKFIDDNECYHYVNEILKQDYNIPKWMKRVTRSQLISRLLGMFYEDTYEASWQDGVIEMVSNLSDDDVTKIYYKNNFLEFTEAHEKVLDLYDDLFAGVKNLPYAEKYEDIPEELRSKFTKGQEHDKVKAYNEYVNIQYFLNPNSPPDSIKEILDKLKDLYMKYVYIPFMSIDRIHRLKYFMRRTVCIVDTDSNILNIDEWVNFCNRTILRNSSYGRSAENNKFICVNTLTYYITAAVQHTLNEYGLHSYIPDDYRPIFNMKNEFYFQKLVVGKKKKRYISAMKLREGNMFHPYKQDTKGFDYMKAGTAETANKRFDNIVRQYILESVVPDVSGILYELKKFEEDILNSLRHGEITYLTLASAKEKEAYANPYSQQAFRGAIAWNAVYPDDEIQYPSKVSILKLTTFTENDIKDLQNTYPEVYDALMRNVFHSPDKQISDKGLQIIAIPSGHKIPDWCQPYIDVQTVIGNTLAPFKGVLDIFGVDIPTVGKNYKTANRKTGKFSNIVRF